MRVLLSVKKGRSIPLTQKKFTQIFQQILKLFPSSQQEVEVVMIDSKEMKILNKKYRAINRPTDILSFSMGSGPLLGSIVIDLDTATKQSIEYQQSLKQELKELFIHGVLHLLGMDHKNAHDAFLMKRYENYMIRRTIGI